MTDVGCPSPEPGTNWRAGPAQPPLCIGRYEGTDRFLGRTERPRALCSRRFAETAPRYVCGADTCRLHLPVEMKSAHASGHRLRQHKKAAKIPLMGIFCLLTRCRWRTPDGGE